MNISNELKSFLEEHQDLLENDIVELVAKYFKKYYFASDKKVELLNIVQTVLHEMTDLDTKIQQAKNELNASCKAIADRYEVAGIVPTIQVADRVELSEGLDLTKYSLYGFCVTTTSNSDVPKSLPKEYTYTLRYGYTAGTLVQLIKGGVKSSAIAVPSPRVHLVIKDLYTQEFIKSFSNMYEKVCEDLVAAIDTCIKSFNWRPVVENDIAPELLTKLNELSEEILDEEIYSTRVSDNYIMFTVPHSISRQTKLDFNFQLNFFEDPANINIDQIISDVERKLRKFIGTLDRRSARRSEIDRTTPIVKITRKDVNDAIIAAGFLPSSVAYTNKYQTSTTYTYAFMNVSKEGCERIKHELEKLGVNVIGVGTSTSMSGRGSYTSLFVRVSS